MSPMRALIEAQVDAIHHLLIANGVWLGLSLITLGMRLWTKTVILRSIQLDDCCIIAATITLSVTCGFTFYLNHMFDQILLTGILPSSSQLSLTSLCILLHRIFSLDGRRTIIIWIVGIFTAVTGLFALIFTAATCGPVATLAKCSVAEAYSDIGAVTAGVNTFTDLVLIIISVKSLWKTNMTRRRTISTIALLLLGATTCIVSFIRLIWTWGIPASYATRHSAAASFFPITEMGAALTGTSLSCCRPLLR
ncbi:hypothetical protein K461DRAFT_316213 [Myriangium duriaei CBS 260.36]|uniref:Rhodopsin domain-containing protein n=1 Tax=Myriangium duriaei CBS 260.36 TaxID=1168546 RepID=A0A9P4MI03_9PEZI|nr:hypothetical protein K461DRAFT_316213 [Myriangium duriaei CBS 260.36]